MKKYLLLLFLPLLIVISACDEDEPEPEIPNVEDGVPSFPGFRNSYTSKVINCDCGKTYVVYFKKPDQDDLSMGSDTYEKDYPSGESNDWIVKIIDGETTVNYPMTIVNSGGLELFCQWSCACGKKFSERRQEYKR